MPVIDVADVGSLGDAFGGVGPETGTMVVVGLFAGVGGVETGAGAAALLAVTGIDAGAFGGAVSGFQAAIGDTAHAIVPAADGLRQVTLVGLGRRELISDSVLRDAALAASTGRKAATGPAHDLSLLALEAPETSGRSGASAAAAVAEGHALGSWRYRDAAGDDARLTVLVVLSAVKPSEGRVARALVVARATNWVRRLVETPSNLLGPAEFAGAIRSLADELAPGGIDITEWGTAELAEHGFGGTLGVGAGSDRHPRAVLLKGGGAGPVTALAGKGITFDSGGINLKRDLGELAWMKSDMAGAAAVAGATIAGIALGSERAIQAVLPIAENMASGSAQRPGDVVHHPDGRTTEVTDTDCEGRLILADALAWLAAGAPDLLIDVGTLTDSGGVGTAYWGCWSTAPDRAGELVAAGERAGDPGWLLPLHDSYMHLLDSRVADIANASLEAPDSGQLAATYLRTFTHDVPWIHIDNGSGAWLERDSGVWRAGPTGTPLRAIVELLAPAE